MDHAENITVHPISLGFVQAYIIDSPAGRVLVDTGIARQEQKILAALRQLGWQPGAQNLALILITHAHADHYGSAAALKRATGAPVAIHRLDAPFMATGKGATRVSKPLIRLLLGIGNRLNPVESLPADVLLEDGERLDRFGLPGKVVLTPGHTPGSLTLVLDDGTAFIGDLVSTQHSPTLQRQLVDDWAALRETFLRLRGMSLKMVYVGHGQRPLPGEDFDRLVDEQIDRIRPNA